MRRLTAVLTALIMVLTACRQTIPPEYAAPETESEFDGEADSTAASESESTGEFAYSLDDIGKTFDQIRAEHPELIFEDAGWVVNYCCLKAPDRYFYYFFHAYQADYAASLEDLGALYGDKLKALGVFATVGDVFPETPDNMPFGEFFESIGVSEYDYDPFGHYWFEYGGAYCEINAPENAEFMERGFQILYDPGIASNRDVIRDYFKDRPIL